MHIIQCMEQGISLKSERKNHDLNHDLTFSAHSIRSMFRILGIYNFGRGTVVAGAKVRLQL